LVLGGLPAHPCRLHRAINSSAEARGDWPSHFITWNAHEWDVRN
jgi:hypothetical protein